MPLSRVVDTYYAPTPKGANVLLDGKDTAKLADFGISKDIGVR